LVRTRRKVNITERLPKGYQADLDEDKGTVLRLRLQSRFNPDPPDQK
tara:strand:+ start:67595 stop:67735 length:141 start_codon:yes stop_codon:yes gene_type:complete